MTDNNELAEALAEIAVLRRRWSDSESKLAACDSDLRTILAERDALRVDAARFAFCVDHAAWPVLANDGETWVMLVAVKGRRRSTFMAATAAEAIDAAMAAEGRE